MMMISMRHTGREAYFSPTRAMLERWREGAKTLERIETYIPTTGTLAKAGGAEILRGTGVSAGMPGMLGITAVRGRMLGPTDVAPGAPSAIMLTEQYWRRAYGGSESAIGSTMLLGETTDTIVGIWPAGARLEMRTHAPEFFRSHAAPRAPRQPCRPGPDAARGIASSHVAPVTKESVDSYPPREALVVGVVVIDRRLRVAPAVIPFAVVEIDEPQAFGFDAH